MVWEITFFDYGTEVGTFDFTLSAPPAVGVVLEDDMGQTLVTAMRSCDTDRHCAAVEIEYLD